MRNLIKESGVFITVGVTAVIVFVPFAGLRQETQIVTSRWLGPFTQHLLIGQGLQTELLVS